MLLLLCAWERPGTNMPLPLLLLCVGVVGVVGQRRQKLACRLPHTLGGTPSVLPVGLCYKGQAA